MSQERPVADQCPRVICGGPEGDDLPFGADPPQESRRLPRRQRYIEAIQLNL